MSKVLAAAATLLAVVAPAVWADTCNVGLKLFTPKIVGAGRKFMATAVIKNQGVDDLTNFYFQLAVPDFMTPMLGTARASSAAKKGSSGPSVQGRYIHFPAMRLPPRKTLRIKVKVGVPTCQASGHVQFSGMAYSLDDTGGLVCTTTTEASSDVVHKSKWLNARHAVVGNCTTPPAPEEGYGLIGANLRCLQAEPLDNFPSDGGRALAETTDRRGLLTPLVSPAELQCWACCGAYLNAAGPYFFNLGADGQCYCCAECDPLYAPAWTVSNPDAVCA